MQALKKRFQELQLTLEYQIAKTLFGMLAVIVLLAGSVFFFGWIGIAYLFGFFVLVNLLTS